MGDSLGSVPKNPAQALKDLELKAATDKEIASLRAMEAFEEVDLKSVPADIKFFSTMWIYTVKREGTHKARLVARGDHQPEGDYYASTNPMKLVLDCQVGRFSDCVRLCMDLNS